MEWIIVIGLILFGITLLIAEVVFIPGVFIAGFIGLLFNISGVYLGYQYFGSNGHYILVFALIANALALIFTFRGKSWERFSLRQVHSSKVNEDLKLSFKVGDKGTSISSIKPFGKALFNDEEIEVKSKGKYIDEDEEIEIIGIENGKIIVNTTA